MKFDQGSVSKLSHIIIQPDYYINFENGIGNWEAQSSSQFPQASGTTYRSGTHCLYNSVPASYSRNLYSPTFTASCDSIDWSFWYKCNISSPNDFYVSYSINGGTWAYIEELTEASEWKYIQNSIEVNFGDSVRFGFFYRNTPMDKIFYMDDFIINGVELSQNTFPDMTINNSSVELQSMTLDKPLKISSSSSVVVQNCNLNNIDISGQSSLELQNSSVSSNLTHGINANNAIIEINNSILSNSNGHGIHSFNGTNLSIKYSLIQNNAGTGVGTSGSLHYLSLQNSVISDNGNYGVSCAGYTEMNYMTIANNNEAGIVSSCDEIWYINNSIVSGNNDVTGLQIIELGEIIFKPYTYWTYNPNHPPLFYGTDYLLSAESPCIDAGTPSDYDINIPPALGTIHADMGAYGGPENDGWGGSIALSFFPLILSINDVPNDQGGWVDIQFRGSAFDYEVQAVTISGYSIHWLAVPPNLWTEVYNIDASQNELYSLTTYVREDSCSSGLNSEIWKVIALDHNGNNLFESEPAEGYSVDNLAPAPPTGLFAEASQIGVELSWDSVTATDLSHYSITRWLEGESPEVIATSETSEYLDNDPNAVAGLDYFYAIYGVDIHDNAGEPSNEASVTFPTATMLSYCNSTASAEGVLITWELSDMDNDVAFQVHRSVSGANNYSQLNIPANSVQELTFEVLDSSALPGESYDYRIDVEMEGTTWMLFESNSIQMPILPYSLHQNVPNPFNPSTMIKYDLNKPSPVKLTIYDIAGRVVNTLINGEHQSAGRHQMQWRGLDAKGRQVTSGAYFYVIEAGQFRQSKRMLLLK